MAKLSPVYIDAQFIAGVPANGALLFTYVAGSTTKITTYADEGATTPNPNPIVLDSRGEPSQPIWLIEGSKYKFVFCPPTDSDPPTNPIRTIDNVIGVGDNITTISQWQSVGVTPTYVNANQFVLTGDQLNVFTIGRRVKALVTAGTVYGTITDASFNGLITTVTINPDSGVLDTGLSSVQLGLITPEDTSSPANIDNTFVILDNVDKSKGFKFEVSGVATATTRTATVPDKDGTLAYLSDVTSSVDAIYANLPQLPQSVSYGPFNVNGTPSFLPATSPNLDITTQNISSSFPLIVRAANGNINNGSRNRTGISTTNLTFTGLTASQRNYLYVDVDVNGALTAGFTTLAPSYQFAGARSIVNLQSTFNYGVEMSMTVGNGASAVQVYRVFIGEAITNATTVTSTIAYAYNGGYESSLTNIATSNTYTFNHNLGLVPNQLRFEGWIRDTVSGYVLPYQIDSAFDATGDLNNFAMALLNTDRNAIYVRTGSTAVMNYRDTTGTVNTRTSAELLLRLKRAW